MNPDVYPPLRQWIEELRQEIDEQKARLGILCGRLRVCEELMDALLKQKEKAREH